MTTVEIPTFSSEEERNKFIDGDREKRILVDTVEAEVALRELENISKSINIKTSAITDFYRFLNNKLAEFEIGTAFILRDDEDEVKDQQYRLCYFEDASGDLFFWRLGYAKLDRSWTIVCHLYKIEWIDEIAGEDNSGINHRNPHHVFLENNTIRLTHGSRDLRFAASHIIVDFIKMFHRQLSYSEGVADVCLKRVEKLQHLVDGSI